MRAQGRCRNPLPVPSCLKPGDEVILRLEGTEVVLLRVNPKPG